MVSEVNLDEYAKRYGIIHGFRLMEETKGFPTLVLEVELSVWRLSCKDIYGVV